MERLGGFLLFLSDRHTGTGRFTAVVLSVLKEKKHFIDGIKI